MVTTGLYAEALHGDATALAPIVSRLHVGTEATQGVGDFRVEWSAGRLARIVSRVLRFPRPCECTAVALLVERDGTTEIWRRRFGDQPLVSRQQIVGRHLTERVGPIEIVLGLDVDAGALVVRSRGVRIVLGRIRLLLPALLSLDIAARVEESDDGLRAIVTVEIASVVLGTLLRYSGELTIEVGP